MAIIKSPLFSSISGKLGDEYVCKQYGSKMVLAKRPKKYKRTRSPIKLLYEERFKAAVTHAHTTMGDKELCKSLRKKLKPGQRLYNFLISEYLREEVRKSTTDWQPSSIES